MKINGGVRNGQLSQYLQLIGVPELPPLSSVFDPGYDSRTLEGHLEQSHHLMSALKISMSGWMVASELTTRCKIALAKAYAVPTVTGGGPFEIAVAQHQLPAYLELCSGLAVTRVECGAGFTDMPLKARTVVGWAHDLGLEVQFEVGNKHAGPFDSTCVDELIRQGHEWLEAGAILIVIEARESARGVGLFDADGQLNHALADRLATAIGLNSVVFEAPDKRSQFALLDHFGRDVHLSNIRLEELLRVEIYRRGLHADAFGNARLRPARPNNRIEDGGEQRGH